jgi:hypothetical protein
MALLIVLVFDRKVSKSPASNWPSNVTIAEAPSCMTDIVAAAPGKGARSKTAKVTLACNLIIPQNTRALAGAI